MRVFALAFLLSSILTTAFCADEAEEESLLEKVHPPNIDTDVVARGEGYLIHVIGGSVEKDSIDTTTEPGISLLHTDLKTGKVTLLIKTGTTITRKRKDKILKVALAGLYERGDYLVVALYMASAPGVSSSGIHYGRTLPYVMVIRKSDATLTLTHACASVQLPVEDWPKETISDGVIEKLDNGFKVFGTVFEFTEDGQIEARIETTQEK